LGQLTLLAGDVVVLRLLALIIIVASNLD